MQAGAVDHFNKLVPMNRLRAIRHRFPAALDHITSKPEPIFLDRNGLLTEAIKAPIHTDLDFVKHFTCARLTTALYYDRFASVLPIGTHIATMWQSHVQQFQKGLPQPILDLVDSFGTLEMGSQKASEQFEYGFNFAPEQTIGVVLFHFHQSFSTIGFVYGVSKPKHLNRSGLFEITEQGIRSINMLIPDGVHKSLRRDR